jgi:hypothetical protein
MRIQSLSWLATCLPLLGGDIRWSATGTVDTVAGTGLSATAGDPVSIKFSYDRGATEHVVTWIPGSYSKIHYYGPVNLTMEVEIGANSWSASLPHSPTGALYVEANSGFLITDLFRVTAAAADSATFSPFPHTGADGARSIQVTLRDTHEQSLFLIPRSYPDESASVASITDGSGSVKAGGDAIHFTIDPASVRVTTDEPKFPLAIKRTLAGIELRWPTEAGKYYTVQQGDSISSWEEYGIYPGSGADIVIVLNPFDEHPERRFYRVISN